MENGRGSRQSPPSSPRKVRMENTIVTAALTATLLLRDHLRNGNSSPQTAHGVEAETRRGNLPFF